MAVPMFRPLRLLMLLTASGRLFRGGGLERGAPGAMIEGFGDSLWRAAATVSTVGYGDLYVVTVVGRIIATGLVLVGIAQVGVITASVAEWFVAQNTQSTADAEAAEAAEGVGDAGAVEPSNADGAAGRPVTG